MPRTTIETEPLHKHTLQLYQGDFDKLGDFYSDVGASVAIRRIIREHLKRLEAGITPVPFMDLENGI